MTLVHLYAFTLITSEIERKTCLNVVIDVTVVDSRGFTDLHSLISLFLDNLPLRCTFFCIASWSRFLMFCS